MRMVYSMHDLTMRNNSGIYNWFDENNKTDYEYMHPVKKIKLVINC